VHPISGAPVRNNGAVIAYVFRRAVYQDIEVLIRAMFGSELLLQRLNLFGGVSDVDVFPGGGMEKLLEAPTVVLALGSR
jgi:TfoX/Sxy family transcriptional regulator of competence genes